jgi:hypothetical protein
MTVEEMTSGLGGSSGSKVEVKVVAAATLVVTVVAIGNRSVLESNQGKG